MTDPKNSISPPSTSPQEGLPTLSTSYLKFISRVKIRFRWNETQKLEQRLPQGVING